jgi:hypothetical protein
MKKIIDPPTIKKNLLAASLFVTAFEMLKSSVEDKIRGLLGEIIGFDDEKGIVKTRITPRYKEAILDRDIPEVTNKKSDFQVFYASCLWFQDSGAITQEEVKDLQAIRKHRNQIAHNPVRLLIDDDSSVNLELLSRAHHLLNKIDKWWILEIEMSISGEYDADHGINETQVDSGMTLLLNYFMEVAAEEVSSKTKPSGT